MRFGACNRRSVTVENDPPTADLAELAQPLGAGQKHRQIREAVEGFSVRNFIHRAMPVAGREEKKRDARGFRCFSINFTVAHVKARSVAQFFEDCKERRRVWLAGEPIVCAPDA